MTTANNSSNPNSSGKCENDQRLSLQITSYPAQDNATHRHCRQTTKQVSQKLSILTAASPIIGGDVSSSSGLSVKVCGHNVGQWQ